MDKFNKLPEEERKTAYTEVSRRLSLPPTAAEKDFWVCWTLRQLVTAKELGEYLTFKGGTSLSKAYGLIDRFSEDIDLTIGHDARFLKDGLEPMEGDISGKERDRRIKALKANAQSFVAEVAFPILEQKIKDSLGEHGNWNLTLDEKDNDHQTILFHYPRLMNYGMGFGMGGFGVGRFGEGEIGYIKPIVKLEFGARGEIEPSKTTSITPYVAKEFPQLFDSPATDVQTLAAERTFWEKVTILHALHHGAHIRDRMSRHYYDTYIMDQKGVTEAALKDVGLLEKVVRNKSLLFKDNKASYETAKIGSLKLLPDNAKLAELKRDYTAMDDMFIGEAPHFDALIDGLKALEEKLNS